MEIRMALGMAGCMILLLAGKLPAQEKPEDKQDEVRVNYAEVELDLLAQQVERVTGKTFLYQTQTLKGKKVTIRSQAPVNAEEFYRLFQTICHMNGLILVPVDEKRIDLVKIVQEKQAQKEPGKQPILLQGETIPKGDELVYYLLSPRNISAAKALAVLQSAVSSSGTIQQVAGTDRLLVIDVASAIRRAEKLLQSIDVTPEKAVSSTVELIHLSVTAAQTQLLDYMKAMESAEKGEMVATRLKILPDTRLNSLELIGPEADVARAKAYLARIDRELPPARRTIQYYKLKNIKAADIVDSVRQLLGLAVAARKAEAAEAIPAQAGKATPEGLVAPPRPRTDKEPAAAPRKTVQDLQEAAKREDIEVIPLDGLNTLVVIGDQEVHKEVVQILLNLDQRKGQVLIEVAILQVTGDDSMDFGLEMLQEDRKGDGAIVSGGVGHGLATQGDPNASGFPEAHTLTKFTGGAFRYLKPDDISVLVKAVASKSNVNILSQPILLVNDNEDADFTTRVSEPTVALSQGTATTTTAFAGFADATTRLRISPQISPGGYINLKITQDFEEFTGTAVTTGVPPPKVSNSVTTVVTVPDNYTAILGGFVRDSVTDKLTGIPIVMEIPVLGRLLSFQSKAVTKSRLYLFVRPRILSTGSFNDLRQASREKKWDAHRFIKGSGIEEEVKRALTPGSGRPVKEAPLPFEETGTPED